MCSWDYAGVMTRLEEVSWTSVRHESPDTEGRREQSIIFQRVSFWINKPCSRGLGINFCKARKSSFSTISFMLGFYFKVSSIYKIFLNNSKNWIEELECDLKKKLWNNVHRNAKVQLGIKQEKRSVVDAITWLGTF